MFKKAITLTATMAFAMTSAAGAVVWSAPHHGHGPHPAVQTLYAHVHVLPNCTLNKAGSHAGFKFHEFLATDAAPSGTATTDLTYVCSTMTHPRLTLSDSYADYALKGKPAGNSPENFFLTLNSNNWVPFTIDGTVTPGGPSGFVFHNRKSPGGANHGVLPLVPGTNGTIALTGKLGTQGGIFYKIPVIPVFVPGQYSDIVTATLYF